MEVIRDTIEIRDYLEDYIVREHHVLGVINFLRDNATLHQVLSVLIASSQLSILIIPFLVFMINAVKTGKQTQQQVVTIPTTLHLDKDKP